MKATVREWSNLFDWAHSHIKTGYKYHTRCKERYIKTAMLVEDYVDLSPSSSVAEVGVGLLLPMICEKWQCTGTAYGLLSDSWYADLSLLGLSAVYWDANEQLADDLRREQHDLVLCCEVIEHLNRWPLDVLSDLHSLLRPGGVLLLTTVNFVRLSNRIRMLFGKSPLINPFEKTPDGSNHIREYTVGELKRYLTKSGFICVVSKLWSIYPPGATATVARLCGLLAPSVRSHIAIVARKG